MFDFSSQHAVRSRRGFTLVEMLVSVGLVVLMMSLFAFIFQVATGTMSRQRTISQNNQKVRLVATLLTNDLKKRTFRNLVPFMPHELEDHPTNFSDRRGYFYLSENSPYVETDTVLQFTIDSENAEATAAVSRGFVGRAQAHVGIGNGVINPTEHPDSDNGRLGDNLATARHAEVAYFVRNGNLYRRLLLIRNERPTTEFVTGNQPVMENYNINRFDFSMRENMAAAVGGSPGSAEFSVASDLDNLLDTKPPTNDVYASMKGLGLPQNRFGFWKPNAVQNPTHTLTGQSYEWLGSGANAVFIGRFTMQETSAAAFTFPNYDPGQGGAANPLLQTLTDTNLDGAVDQFASGTRVGEDLLLSNVLSFTVEVWEPRHLLRPDRFVRLGDIGNSYFTNQTLDTWHRYSRVPTPTITNTPFVASLPPTGPLLRYRPSELGNRVQHVGPFDGVKTVAKNDVYLLWDGDTTGYPINANDNRIKWNWNTTVLRCIQPGVPTAGRPDIREAAGEPDDEIRQGSVIWSVESNVLPVRALQITIRFMHPSTDEPRQITIVQSLIDDEEFRTQ